MTMAAEQRNMSLDDALRDAEQRHIARNPKSRARHAAASRHLPGGNTRSILWYPPFPLTITRGEGARLFDLDGHAYLDFLGEYSAGLYGHSDPVIMAAIKEALADGINFGAPNRYEAELAALMCARFPPLEMVRFCNSGTEANLNALMAARALTGRDAIMVFEHAYHGGTLAFGKTAGPANLPFPYVMGRYNDPDYTLPLIERHANDLAAIILEPMMGGGGCIPADRDFLQSLRDAATRHGILLIFDEVMTSRLAPGGLQGKWQILPDLSTFGKYLGGGMSFGAFGGRADLMRRFDPAHPAAIPHSGTYNNNVLSMAAGAAGLSKVFLPETADTLTTTGETLKSRLNALGARHNVPLQVTGIGSILCLHFQREPIHRPDDTSHTPPAARALCHLELLARNIYTARRGFLTLSLPLTQADYGAFIAAFEDFLTTCGQALASPE